MSHNNGHSGYCSVYSVSELQKQPHRWKILITSVPLVSVCPHNTKHLAAGKFLFFLLLLFLLFSMFPASCKSVTCCEIVGLSENLNKSSCFCSSMSVSDLQLPRFCLQLIFRSLYAFPNLSTHLLILLHIYKI